MSDDASTFAHGGDLVLGRNASAHGGLLCGADTDVEIVPSIIANIERTARCIDLQEVDSTPICSDTHAEIVAVRLHGPVGDTVDVDEAAQYTDGGGVGVVRSDGDAGSDGGRDHREGGSNLGKHVEG